MTRRTRIVGGLLLLAAFLGIGGSAWAYWTSSGTGTGSATTATLNPPTNVAGSYTLGLQSVAVTWTASTGLTPQGYYVTRTNTVTGTTVAVCGSSAASLVAGGCTDVSVPVGSFRYAVTAVYNSWTAAGTPSSAVAVTADTTAPSVAVTSVNGADRTFPYSTNAAVTSIGGTCGAAPGDATTVSPRINGAATTPSTATCSSGAWTLTLTSALTADATVTLSATQVDLTGNVGSAAARTVVVDRTKPTVTSLVRAGASATVNAGPLSWTVTFSEPVSQVAVGNFALVSSGLTGMPTITSATATSTPSTTWTVLTSESGVTASSGTIGLNVTGIGLIVDAAGNALDTTTFTGQTYAYDTTKPTLSSIVRAGSSAIVNAGPLSWTVTFSEPVVNVAAGNFGLAGSGLSVLPSIGTVVSATGTAPSATWTVTVTMTGVTGSNTGSIGLSLAGIGSVVDAAGNALATASSTGPTYTYDTTAPAVIGVSSTLADGSYKAGQLVPVTVTFGESVAVTGTPQLTLATGSPAATTVGYTSVSGGVLTFPYTVVAGNTSSDLDYATSGSLVLNGATITDAAGNAATLTLASPGAAGSLSASKALVIDTAPPVVAVTTVGGVARTFPYYTNAASITQIGGTCGAPATGGDLAPVTVQVNGSSAGTASCSSSGAWTLTVSWTTETTRVVTVTQADAATNVGSDTESVIVDKTAPGVSGVSSSLADGSYRAGQSIPVTVTFPEPVVVTGTPRLLLKTGSSATTNVNYTSGSGSTTLVFTYSVGATDTSTDLDYSTATSLTLNGGTIRDLAGNNAGLGLATPGAANSLGANKNLVIDTTAPTASGGVTSVLTNGTYRTGQLVPITVAFSEAVVVSGTPTLTLSTGSPATTAVNYSGGSGTNTLTFTYTVAAGNYSGDLNYASTAALGLNGGAITDAAGNAATLTLPGLTATGSLGTNKAIVIDAVPPAVTLSLTNQTLLWWSRVRASGTAEYGAGPVTVYLCYDVGANCTASTATHTQTATVGTNGSWQAEWSDFEGTADWYAVATQTDAVGNVGTSAVIGPS